MRREIAVMFACVGALFAGCTSLSRLSYYHPRRSSPCAVRDQAAEVLGVDAGAKVLAIAHKAGACDAYPHDLERGVPENPQPAADLLAHADLEHFNGAEIDARADNEGKVAYVSHEEVTGVLGSASDFLAKDRLSAAVVSFFKSHPQKSLFIELKVAKRDHDGVNEDDRRLARAVLSELEIAEKELPLDATKGRLTFISFTSGALQAVYGLADASSGGGRRFGYHLILGTDRPSLVLFSDLPKLSHQVKFLKDGFVTGVWFSTRSLSSPKDTLSEIRRTNANIDSFVADAYLDERASLRAAFEELAGAGIHLTGLVFDAVTATGEVDGNYCP